MTLSRPNRKRSLNLKWKSSHKAQGYSSPQVPTKRCRYTAILYLYMPPLIPYTVRRARQIYFRNIFLLLLSSLQFKCYSYSCDTIQYNKYTIYVVRLIKIKSFLQPESTCAVCVCVFVWHKYKVQLERAGVSALGAGITKQKKYTNLKFKYTESM